MGKILIVDDSKTNRMTLKYMLDDIVDDLKIDLSYDEAENGLIALEKCKANDYDIVLMDIMMPVMDGIEATKEIRKLGKKNMMIIAVSALDDDESKNKMLTSGAEDYITKPVNEDIFKKRIINYSQLIDNRKNRKLLVTSVNTYDIKVFSRRLIFIVQNESSISEFWDYYLFEENRFGDRLTDLIRVIYGLGLLQVKMKFNCEITVEENSELLIFTMNNIKLLNSVIVKNIISKNYHGEYKIVDDKLSFKFNKELKEIQTPKVVENIKTVETTNTKAVHEDINVKDVFVESASDTTIEVFDFIDKEDLEELENIANELDSLMLLVGSSKIDDSEVLQIAKYIQSFGRMLATYNETYNIANSLNVLSKNIEENISSFQEKSKDIALLCQAFNKDLLLWIRKLFYEGAPSIDFLDSSIISNANMISAFINPQNSSGAEEVDDIFDF
ncbi:MAG: response regulator [Campylobacterales bacterium]|nr:response regulator [Campylobacterales bacterium]